MAIWFLFYLCVVFSILLLFFSVFFFFSYISMRLYEVFSYCCSDDFNLPARKWLRLCIYFSGEITNSRRKLSTRWPRSLFFFYQILYVFPCHSFWQSSPALLLSILCHSKNKRLNKGRNSMKLSVNENNFSTSESRS